MIYFDTSYLARLYLEDFGWEAVRRLAGQDEIVCSAHGKAETAAAFHRKLREGVLDQRAFRLLLQEFEMECHAGAFQWLPITEAVMDHVSRAYSLLPRMIYLRASDALHMASAAENGIKVIYSNDKHLLGAAAYFKLKGLSVF